MRKKPFVLLALAILLTGAVALGYSHFASRKSAGYLAQILAIPLPKTMKIVAQSYSRGREGRACFQVHLSAEDSSTVLAARKYERLAQDGPKRKVFVESTYRLFIRGLPSIRELPAYEVYENYDHSSGATIHLIVDPAHTNIYVLHVRI